MRFLPTDEQQMLRDAVAGQFRRAGTGAGLGALGIPGLLVPEAAGGSGLGLCEAAIVLHEAGRAGAAAGDLAATLVHAEAFGRALPARADALLAGRLALVAPIGGTLVRAGGRLAGRLQLPAPDAGDWLAAPLGDGDEVGFLPAAALPAEPCAAVEADRPGVAVTVDVAAGDLPCATVPDLRDRMAILRCAEMLGAADHCLALALGYIKDRHQFGQPIGANQALAHVAADSYVRVENARVAVDMAAAACDAAAAAPGDAGCRHAAQRAVAVMLAYVPRAAREVAETAVHLHGGIGLTWDYGLNAPLRRIVRLAQSTGSPAAWRRRLCALFRADGGEGMP
jgi:alkylation response protein AidB-like acyl-CoA dehydrogenase